MFYSYTFSSSFFVGISEGWRVKFRSSGSPLWNLALRTIGHKTAEKCPRRKWPHDGQISRRREYKDSRLWVSKEIPTNSLTPEKNVIVHFGKIMLSPKYFDIFGQHFCMPWDSRQEWRTLPRKSKSHPWGHPSWWPEAAKLPLVTYRGL